MPALNPAVESLNALNEERHRGDQELQDAAAARAEGHHGGVCILLKRADRTGTAKEGSRRHAVHEEAHSTTTRTTSRQDDQEDDQVLRRGVHARGGPIPVAGGARVALHVVRAMKVYDGVAKVVRPKKGARRGDGQACSGAGGAARRSRTSSRRSSPRCATAGQPSDEAESPRRSLKDQAQLTTAKRLVRAGKLTSGLADEAVRWKSTVAVPRRPGALTATSSSRRVHRLLWRVQRRLPQEAGRPVGGGARARRSRSATPSRSSRSWASRWSSASGTSGGCRSTTTRRERHPRGARQAMAARHRSTGAGQQVDPQHGAEERRQRSSSSTTRPSCARSKTPSGSARPCFLEDVREEALDPALEPMLQKQCTSRAGASSSVSATRTSTTTTTSSST